MTPDPLKSLGDYSRLVAELLSQPNVVRSTVAVMSFSRPNLPALIQEIELLSP